MASATGFAMSWEEWHRHDASALADRVRAKDVTSKELCAQAAVAIERLEPSIDAVLGMFDDVVAATGTASGGLTSATAGFGLRGMEERVRLLGGSLSVANRSAPTGVLVEARLPRAPDSRAETTMASA